MSQKSIIVQKYGGVCLGTPDRLKEVAASVARLSREGHGVIVVTSAMGKTTDELVKLAYQVSPNPNRREMDMLLTTGERISMALMSMALHDLGCPSISFTGSQAGVMTDGSHSNARIVDVKPIRVQEELDRGRVIVLAGYQGVNPQTKDITTLGRGGSDTTAVAMAAKFSAARCEIIKEVSGICSADPKIVDHAKSWARLAYPSLREMSFWGAKVLHYRSISLAEEMKVKLWIKRWGSETGTTEVSRENEEMENCQVLSINSHGRIEHFEIQGTVNKAYAALEKHLHEKNLARPQILASAFNNGTTRFMLTEDNESLDALILSLKGNATIQPIKKSLSSVSVTCHGSVATELSAQVMAKLDAAGIEVDKVLFTPLSITVCIDPNKREAAIRTLHSLVTE